LHSWPRMLGCTGAGNLAGGERIVLAIEQLIATDYCRGSGSGSGSGCISLVISMLPARYGEVSASI
jgi:hypothetical protein